MGKISVVSTGKQYLLTFLCFSTAFCQTHTFNCFISGCSQVIIYAALYLKLKRYPSSSEKNRERKAARIVDVLNPTRTGSDRKDLSMLLLLTSNTDLDELILMRPLKVRIKIDCRDHPKADNSKDIILTDSSIDVNVALK